jgi:hypothetical protein
MRQRQAIGIDHTTAGSTQIAMARKTALTHRTSIRRAGTDGLSGAMAQETLGSPWRGQGCFRGDCLPHRRFARPAPSLSLEEFSGRMELARLMSVEMISSVVPAVGIVPKG